MAIQGDEIYAKAPLKILFFNETDFFIYGSHSGRVVVIANEQIRQLTEAEPNIYQSNASSHFDHVSRINEGVVRGFKRLLALV